MANQLYVIGVVVALLVLSACASPSVAQDGTQWRVVDVSAEPPQPVPNAVVLITFRRVESVPGHAATYCSGAELTYADSEGLVTLPPGGVIVAHKPGHAIPAGSPPRDAARHLIVLTSKPSRAEMYSQLRLINSGAAACLSKSPAGGILLKHAVEDLRAFIKDSKNSDELRMARNMEAMLQEYERTGK